jgi:hypothetical protein
MFSCDDGHQRPWLGVPVKDLPQTLRKKKMGIFSATIAVFIPVIARFGTSLEGHIRLSFHHL